MTRIHVSITGFRVRRFWLAVPALVSARAAPGCPMAEPRRIKETPEAAG